MRALTQMEGGISIKRKSTSTAGESQAFCRNARDSPQAMEVQR
jgi:hypothetical protein